MKLDSKNGALITPPKVTYWQLVASPINAVYNFSATTLSYCRDAVQYCGSFVHAYTLGFFKTSTQTNTAPKLSISENSVKQLHETRSLKGDSLTKQIERDLNSIGIFIEGKKQTSHEQLQKNVTELLQKTLKEAPQKEQIDRVLRICQQAIFQPGFEALKSKLESSHIVLQDSSIPLEISLEKHESTINAMGIFGVRVYPTTDFDEIDTINPKTYLLQFKIHQVFSNQMTCSLEEVPEKTVKKIQ